VGRGSADRIAVIVGGARGGGRGDGGQLQRDIAAGLAALGAAVTVTRGFASRADADAAFAAAALRGRVEIVVHAQVDPAVLEPCPLLDQGDADWDRRCEAPIRAALYSLQAAYAHLRHQGGQIVLVCPTVPPGRAAGLVPLAMSAHAQQALAVSAARRWAAERIAVNLVAVPPAAFAAGAGAGVGGIVPLVVFLAGQGAGGLTGMSVTAGADGWAGP
jgi:NAD(P)-dependent dehydrogenase (short-subunit alcohol dehydrogenase family)